MFTIIKRRELNPTVTELWIHAPLIAKKAKAGQFIIVRAKEDSERIPLTIAGFDREAGTVSIIFQVVGAGTLHIGKADSESLYLRLERVPFPGASAQMDRKPGAGYRELHVL